MTFVDFPPRVASVRVSARSGASVRTGVAGLAASTRSVIAAQRAVAAASRVVGAWALPGRRKPWTPPAWLAGALDAVVDGAEIAAVYHRPSTPEGGVALLLSSPPSFVKLRPRPERLAREAEMAARATGDGLPYRVPAVLAYGAVDGASYLRYAALPNAVSVPAAPEVARRVADAIAPRVGNHGDFAPWNVRTVGGATWVIDWEEAGEPAPDGADRAYYELTWAAVRGTPVPDDLPVAALHHWRAVVERRPQSKLDRKLLALLR